MLFFQFSNVNSDQQTKLAKVMSPYVEIYEANSLSYRLLRWITYIPVSSSKTSTPRDQRSTAKSCPLFSIISGATYSGVPQNVHVLHPKPIFLAKPKSVCVHLGVCAFACAFACAWPKGNRQKKCNHETFTNRVEVVWSCMQTEKWTYLHFNLYNNVMLTE